MARIRSVHPGLFTDEAFMHLTVEAPAAVPLLIGLWCEADDQGVFEWKPLTLKARILPATPCDITPLLQRLADAGMIRRFQFDDRAYGAIRNFRKWQRPEKPKHTHPLPDELQDFVYRSPTTPTSKRDRPATDRQPIADKQAPDGVAIADQSPTDDSEEGGRREKEEEVPSPLRSDGARPSAGEMTADELLWVEGVAIYRALAKVSEEPAKRALGKLLRDDAGNDAALLMRLLHQAEAAEISGGPYGWLRAAIRQERAPSLPEAGGGGGGFAAWLKRQKDVEPVTYQDARVPGIAGYAVEPIAECVAEAAGVDLHWRGNWDALGAWIRAGVEFWPPVLDAIRSQAWRMRGAGESIRSLAVFDAAVRNSAGTRAA